MLIVPTLTPVGDDAATSKLPPRSHQQASALQFPPGPSQMLPPAYYEGASSSAMYTMANTPTALAAAASMGYDTSPHQPLYRSDPHEPSPPQQHPSRGYMHPPPPPPPPMMQQQHHRSEFYPLPEQAYANNPPPGAAPASPRFSSAPSPHHPSSPRSPYAQDAPISPSTQQQQQPQHHGSPRFGHPRDTTGV